MFGVIRNLAVPVLLSTSFVDQCIEDIFPGELKMVPFNASAVPIIILFKTETENIEEQQDETVSKIMPDYEFTKELVRVANTIIPKPLSESSVLVATKTKSIVHLDALRQFKQSYPCKELCGVLDVYPRRLFHIIVAKASNSVMKIVKYQRVATAIWSPSATIHIKNEKFPSPQSGPAVNSVNVFHY